MKTSDVVINVFVLPGGMMPQEPENGNVGYDVFVRAIVTKEWDKENPLMHETVWDFTTPPPRTISRAQTLYEHEKGRWIYSLKNSESILLGLGFVMGGESMDWKATNSKRGNFAMQKGDVDPDLYTDHLRGVPIDPNFRGECLAFITNTGLDSIKVFYGWSPVQMEFKCHCCKDGFIRPRLEQIKDASQLGKTFRGNCWNGSTNHRFVQQELLKVPYNTYQHHREAVGK